MKLRALLDRTPAEPWSLGGKIPWNDPAFSARMLREHLSQLHDRASRRSDLIDRQVAWIHDGVLAGKTGRVLDLGCGPGLYASRLAALGHSCVGIDFSPASIEHASAVAERDGLACEYELSDLRDASLGAGHHAALLLFGELNTFPRAEACDLLRRVSASLAPGARVILEVHTEEAVRARGLVPPGWSTQTSGLFADAPHLILRECFWHESEAAAVERYFVFVEGAGAPEIMASTTRAYSSGGYAELLADAGLEEVERHPCLTGSSSPVDPGLFVIVAAAAGGDLLGPERLAGRRRRM